MASSRYIDSWDRIVKPSADPTPTRGDKNNKYCARIAQELEAYAAGRMWRDVETGEEKEMDPETVSDDFEQLSIYDYLADVLDYEITIDSRLEYKSAKIWVTLGGPNVWIDTAEKAVKLAWGTDRAEYLVDWDACEEIDEYMRDLYTCQKEG